MIPSLAKQWLQLCEDLELKVEFRDRYWEELSSHYGGADRHYHNLQHIEELLQWVAIYADRIIDKEILLLSIWYHDIIYVPGRKDNEAESAAFARKRLSNFELSPDRIEKCTQQILATQAHQLLSDDPDLAYLLDFDLAILAKPWEDYQVYAEQIRKEFAAFPDHLYRVGRKQALQRFLTRPAIYHTPVLYERWEKRARQNIQAEIRLQLNDSAN